jgi:hypothetical protein
MTITPADSLDLLIAHGPPDATDFAKQIAGLPGAYYAGLDEAYKRRNENAFQGGVPTTTIIGPDGKPQTVPDYNAAGIKALELGGTQAVAPFATLAGLDINRQNQLGDVTAARIRAGEEVPGVPGAQPSTPGSNLPPPSARITVQPANRPPGSSNGMSATSVNAAVSQGGFSGAEAGSLMTRIAQGLGVDPDQNLDPVKQAQVATAVQRAIAARQQRTPAQPPAASAAPSQSSFNDRFAGDNAPITRPPVAAVPAGIDPNSPIPPRYQGGREQEFISALQRSLATGTKEGREATAAKLKAIEEYQAKNADIERAARTEEGKKQVETLSKLADAGSEAQGHTAQIEQIRQLGR